MFFDLRPFKMTVTICNIYLRNPQTHEMETVKVFMKLSTVFSRRKVNLENVTYNDGLRNALRNSLSIRTQFR